jgi:hypothetical protein
VSSALYSVVPYVVAALRPSLLGTSPSAAFACLLSRFSPRTFGDAEAKLVCEYNDSARSIGKHSVMVSSMMDEQGGSKLVQRVVD